MTSSIWVAELRELEMYSARYGREALIWSLSLY